MYQLQAMHVASNFRTFQVYLVDSGQLRLYRVGLEELDQPIDSYEVVLRHNVFGTEGQFYICLSASLSSRVFFFPEFASSAVHISNKHLHFSLLY